MVVSRPTEIGQVYTSHMGQGCLLHFTMVTIFILVSQALSQHRCISWSSAQKSPMMREMVLMTVFLQGLPVHKL